MFGNEHTANAVEMWEIYLFELKLPEVEIIEISATHCLTYDLKATKDIILYSSGSRRIYGHQVIVNIF